MLTNSPGNVNFETSPFKLTQEYLDIMDGEKSDNYEYFRRLIVSGFLEARKHSEEIILFVELMMPGYFYITYEDETKIIIIIYIIIIAIIISVIIFIFPSVICCCIIWR